MKNVVRRVRNLILIVVMVLAVVSQGVPTLNLQAEALLMTQVSNYKAEVNAFAAQNSSRTIHELFPDKNLAELIREKLEKKHITDNITIAELDQIRGLSTRDLKNGKKVADLTGIWYLRNLGALVMSYQNDITDFMPLLTLPNLVSLSISGMYLKDWSIIGRLSNLRNLVLTNGTVTDIGFIKNLRNLIKVNLMRNGIRDMSPLSELPNLREVVANYNCVEDVNWIVPMPAIQQLYLEYNRVMDVSPLKGKEFSEKINMVINTVIEKKIYYDEDGFTMKHKAKGVNGAPPYFLRANYTEYDEPYMTWSGEVLKNDTFIGGAWWDYYSGNNGGGILFTGEYNLEVVGR